MNDKLLTIIEKDGKASRGKDPNLGKEQLQMLYRVMVQTRAMDERGLVLQRQGSIGFYLPSTGQEASHVGGAFALRETDWIFPAYRQPGIPLLRGVPLDQIVDEWYGNVGDICKGRQMPVHYSFRSAHFVSISSPIGTQISQAAGAAIAAKLRHEDTVCMTFFGDGGTSSNDFHAGLNFAAVFKAPVVFVCENNQWAISVPYEQQTSSETIAAKAEAYGMPGVRVDGNDILAVYRVCKEAAERARKGGGPTLVETVTFRVGPHSSSDDPTRYRDPKTVEEWKQRDPIERFRKYLKQKGLWNDKLEQETWEQARQAVKDASKRAETKPRPDAASMFADVYLAPTPQLREQFAELQALGQEGGENVGEFPL
jgi:2-oxoisovalerate dehydrogenase E1 component alpha subunit